MIYFLSFLPEVEEDALSGYRWYEEKAVGLGEEFLRVFYALLLKEITNMDTLSQIEKSIEQFPRETQLLLVERIIHKLRRNGMKDQINLDKQLIAMAEDPEIKIETQKIKEEFAIAESDGLEKL